NTEYVEIQQQYNEVAQQLRYLKSEYDRQKTLFDEKITSQKNFLKAESDYKSSLAMYNALRKKLQMMNINPDAVEQGNIQAAIGIYAPINGSITKVNVSTGSYVSPSEEIMEIVNTDHIHLELSVFEKDILKIKKGQKITFTIPEASDKIYTGEVHLVGTSVDPTDRTVKVHGHIEGDEDLNLVTGMYVEATIITHPVANYGLPVDAVVQSGDENFVLVLKGKKGADYEFEQVQVETGKRNADFVEIMNGAELKNKQILTSGAFMAAK
ncbi:MAG: efflux RND transporter periplasmic adaptor subunit, partial [Flavobacteriaceae bacterium]|nr:efflux RND transporter periplasmic adaptor subunit [Flavobacteriaceae bacterium]